MADMVQNHISYHNNSGWCNYNYPNILYGSCLTMKIMFLTSIPSFLFLLPGQLRFELNGVHRRGQLRFSVFFLHKQYF
jgi:hypothetical protein